MSYARRFSSAMMMSMMTLTIIIIFV